MDMARLTRASWIDAAYARFNADGLAAVAVEPIARELGATKGSFYWHFVDRGELVGAVLKRWEHIETDEVIVAAEEEGAPADRIARLIDVIAHRSDQRGGELTLYATAAAHGVEDVVARVAERRIEYVTAQVAGLGFDEGESRRRAIILVAAILGFQQMVATGWDPREGPQELVDSVFAATVAGAAAD